MTAFLPSPGLKARPAWRRGAALLVAVVVLLSAAGCREPPGADGIPTGTAWFRFAAPSSAHPDREIRVYTYRPAAHGADDPILFVMHGASRNADDYRDRWIEAADRYRLLIVAPRIDEDDFSWEEFRLGGVVRNREALPVPADGPPRSDWTFTLMERLFDHVRAVTGSRRDHYDLFGHSAGGQFAHRFTLFLPGARTGTILAANAGWYTFPTTNVRFPYALAGFPTRPPLGPPDYAGMFGKRLVLVLGTADTERDRNLLKTPEADAQGPHRLARGHAFFTAGQTLAVQMGLPFRWEVVEVPGVGHSSADVVPHVARWLYGG